MVNGLAVAELRCEPRLEPDQVPKPERLRTVEERRELTEGQFDRVLVDSTRLDLG